MKKKAFFCLMALAGLGGLLLPGASITVAAPVAGESLRQGCHSRIQWSASGVSGDVRIALYRDNGDRLGIIENRIAASAGSFLWTVGELSSGSAGAGEGYRVRVVEILGDTVGQSGSFSIAAATPLLRIDSPNGGETLTIGAQGHVHYEYSNLPGGDLILELYRGGTAAANRVGRLYPGLQSGHTPCGSSDMAWFNGYVSGTYAAEGRSCYYVRVMTPDGSLSDFSDAPFSLAAPPAEEPAEEPPAAGAGSITISSPLAPLTLSHDFSLGWNARNIDGELVINVLREAGGTWTIATSVDPGRAYGRFHWIVGQLPNRNASFPAVAGQRFRFQISGRGSDGRAVIATGRWFEIVSPEIDVREPHAGERLERGGHKTIMWSAPALHGGVHVEAYYRGRGEASFSKYARLFEDIANNGHRTWNIWDRPHGMTGSIDAPLSGNDIRWHIRVISARCPWIFAEGPEFILD